MYMYCIFSNKLISRRLSQQHPSNIPATSQQRPSNVPAKPIGKRISSQQHPSNVPASSQHRPSSFLAQHFVMLVKVLVKVLGYE